MRKYMKMIEQLPKHPDWYILPNQMVAYYGYACGKMSINGPSTIVGPLSQVITKWLSCCYT